jgi:hypothetical protein
VADDVHCEGPLQTAVTLVQSERFVYARERADFHLVALESS